MSLITEGPASRRGRSCSLWALGAILAIALALAMPANGWAVEEDITPPEVTALSVSPNAVNVTSESKSVTVTATIVDPPGEGGVSSGVESGSVSYAPSSGTGYATGYFTKKTGSEYTATVTFPKYVKEDTWKPSVNVRDRVGNYRSYTAAELEAKGFQANVKVTSTPDTMPPEISSVTVGPPTSVNVSPPNGTQSVPVTATVTDNLSGVASVSVTYRGPGTKHAAYAYLQHSSGNQYTGKLEIRPYQEAGSWSPYYVSASDAVGNSKTLQGSELASLSLPNIQVTSEPVDLEGPKLVSLKASAEPPCQEGLKGACVDAEKGDRTVTIKATITDNLSGVAYPSVYYVSPGVGQQQTSSAYLTKKSGNEYEGTLTIRQYSKAGYWKPSVYLTDNAGNGTSVYGSEISEEAWIAVSRTEEEEAKPGGPPVSTGESANEVNPLQSQLSVPEGGTGGLVKLKITPRTTETPPGFYLLDQQLDITAPTQPDTSHPLKIVFLVDSSVFTGNGQVQLPPGCESPGPGMPPPNCTLTVFKNGVKVPACTAVPPAPISPDPCIVEPQEKAGDDTKLTIYSTSASTWNVGIPLAQSGEATELTTSLSGGGQSGGSITVPANTAVSDSATLSGTNAAEASGNVEYDVYSDSACTQLVRSAGTVEVSEGSVDPSEAVELAAGTYYWQATYSGDGSLNEGSKSKCGSEVETVGPPPPPPCKTVIGSANVVIRKEGETERQKVENKLSTNLASKQKLIFTWENAASKLTLTKLTSASCVVSTLKKKFIGQGQVTVNGETGWIAKFYFVISNKQAFTFHIRLSKPKEEPFAFTDRAASLTSETIS